jgi:glycerol kinase
LARAVLEATAFQTREVVEAMEKDSGDILQTLRVDGGMVGNHLLMQFQADVLKRTVISPGTGEITALGAAYAAGLGTGFYSSTAELKANWSAGCSWVPGMETATRREFYSMWRKAVTRSLDWAENS